MDRGKNAKPLIFYYFLYGVYKPKLLNVSSKLLLPNSDSFILCVLRVLL